VLTVDFVYALDCPNAEAARANLLQAFPHAGFSPSWTEHRIGDPAAPERVHGYGSPTILVNGRDIAGAEPSTEACCRIYSNGQGVPTVEMIAAALVAAMQTHVE